MSQKVTSSIENPFRPFHKHAPDHPSFRPFVMLPPIRCDPQYMGHTEEVFAVIAAHKRRPCNILAPCRRQLGRSVGRSDGRSVVRSFPRLGLTLPLSELDTGTCIYYPGQVQDSVPLSVLLQAPPDSSRVTMLVSSQQQCWSVGWLCWREATRTFAAKNYPAQVLMIKLLITTRRRSDSAPRSLE